MSMVYPSAALALSFLIAMAATGDDKPPQDELAKLRGTWLTISLVSDGKTVVDDKTPPKPDTPTVLVYEGDQWMIRVGDKIVARGKFKVDATKMPKEIDVFDESGLTNEKTKRGIYQISGDTYRFCLAPAGKARPTEFSSKPGSGHSLGVSKRAKP
jgi:uncharacterized protein (TIGR03067 family)